MRSVRLALCIVGLATLYPAVSNATEICYSAYVPAATPQWRTACDGEIGGTTGQSWGVAYYTVNAPDPSIGGGHICYSAYTAYGWLSPVCDGNASGYNSSTAIQMFRISTYTGAGTLQYRAHVQDNSWMSIVGFNSVVGVVGKRMEALEVNINFPGETEYWQAV